jgi:hypothetical protein
MDEAASFEIGGVVYPVPTAFRITDPALVREVTGMDWAEFVEGLREEEQDPVLVSGLVAVAVSQANPGWRRDRIIRYLGEIDFEELGFNQPSTNGADAGPPDETPEQTPPSG